MGNLKAIAARIPPSLYAKLKNKADYDCRSIGNVITVILLEYFNCAEGDGLSNRTSRKSDRSRINLPSRRKLGSATGSSKCGDRVGSRPGAGI